MSNWLEKKTPFLSFYAKYWSIDYFSYWLLLFELILSEGKVIYNRRDYCKIEIIEIQEGQKELDVGSFWKIEKSALKISNRKYILFCLRFSIN